MGFQAGIACSTIQKRKAGVYLGEGGKKRRIQNMGSRCLHVRQDSSGPTKTNYYLILKIGQLPCAYKEINQSGNFGLYIIV
jgi:hypothetical protein